MQIDPQRFETTDTSAASPARTARIRTTPRLIGFDRDHSPAVPRVTVARLRLPERDVRVRATAVAERMRVLGTQHTLRVWRDAHREAIMELAREASGAAGDATCEALFWERDNDVYHVSATFAPSQRAIH